jgi:diaminopimelate decarboxylase
MLKCESPPLPPIQHPHIFALLTYQQNRLFEWISAFGSPLHLVLPQIFEQNVQSFAQVFSDLDISGKILFAHKANKSPVFLECCAASEIGVDISSIYEMQSALAHGIRGENISVSGPMKDPRLLLLAVQHKATIVLDSITELQELINLSKRLNTEATSVLLRCTGPDIDSRFGLPLDEWRAIYPLLHQSKSLVSFRGFAFHLNGYSIKDRAKTTQQLCLEINRLRQESFTCNIINLGGGFTIPYVHLSDWQQFLERLNPNFFHRNKLLSEFYPYAPLVSKDQFLRQLLESQNDEILPLHTQLKQSSIEIWIEPGRALLDQAGLTIFRIQGINTRDKYHILTVAGNSFHLSEQWFNTEFALIQC